MISKASFMEKPNVWAGISIFGFMSGIALMGKIVFHYTVSATLLAYPVELVSFAGLLLSMGATSSLLSYYAPGFSSPARLDMDLFGTSFYVGGWLMLTIMVSMNYPDSLFFTFTGLSLVSAGAIHGLYLRSVRKDARERGEKERRKRK